MVIVVFDRVFVGIGDACWVEIVFMIDAGLIQIHT